MSKSKKAKYLNFVELPELKCSYFLVDKKKNDVLSLLIRVGEGRHKGIIVEVSEFKLVDNTNKLTFDFDIVYNPYDEVANIKTLEMFVKKTVSRIITNALRLAINDERENENRDSSPKVAPVK